MPTEEIVVVGRIGSPYGVKGWSNVHSFTVPPDNLLSYEPWYLADVSAARWQACAKPDCRRHKKAYVAQFRGVEDRDAASALTGQLIGVPRQSLPETEPDEYYWGDLVGAQVRTRSGAVLGRVLELLETGAHDVLVIQNEGGRKDGDAQLLIPFADPYLYSVDTQKGEVIVDWDPEW